MDSQRGKQTWPRPIHDGVPLVIAAAIYFLAALPLIRGDGPADPTLTAAGTTIVLGVLGRGLDVWRRHEERNGAGR